MFWFSRIANLTEYYLFIFPLTGIYSPLWGNLLPVEFPVITPLHLRKKRISPKQPHPAFLKLRHDGARLTDRVYLDWLIVTDVPPFRENRRFGMEWDIFLKVYSCVF